MTRKIIAFLLVMCLLTGVLTLSIGISYSSEEKFECEMLPQSTNAPTNIRTPAEWERSEEILLRWSNSGLDNYYLDLTREIADVSNATIVTGSQSSADSIANYLENNGVYMDNVSFYIVSTNTIWMRDYGPISIIDKTTGELSFVNMMYDRWNRWEDDAFPWRYAEEIEVDCYSMTDGDNWFRLEGGNLMVDGAGIFYTTDRCFEQNDPSHGGDLTQEEVIRWATDYFNLVEFRDVIRLSNDGTGHIDMQIKLLNETTVLISEVSPGDNDYEILEYNVRYFENRTARNGQPYNIVRVPFEKPGGTHYTYTNSLIVNNKVLVPIYNRATDSEALQIYQDNMPGYEIVGVDSSDIISSNGAIHCTTMQVAKDNIPPTIDILDVHAPADDNVSIEARITDDGTITFAHLYYNSSTEENVTRVDMELIRGNDTYEAVLPSFPVGTEVGYFIQVQDDFLALNYSGDIWNMHSLIVGVTPPEITLTSPTEGESWDAGTEQDITWYTTNEGGTITGVDIEYSVDAGISWTDIVTETEDNGSYPWTVPDEPTTEARIRVTVSNDFGLSDTDTSENFEIIGIPVLSPAYLNVEHYGVENDTTIETRYMRSDNVLGTVQTETDSQADFTGPGGQTVYVGIRTFVYDGENETELTEGSAVAVVEREANGGGYQTVTWAPPETELSTGDSIIVRVYADLETNPPSTLRSTFTTEELGADVLEGNQWTVNYYTYRNMAMGMTTGMFEWGSGDRNSRIEGFSHSVIGCGNGTEDNLLTWGASPDDPERVKSYNIYRSVSEYVSGPYELIDTINAHGLETYGYVDHERGTADDILWWYKVYSYREGQEGYGTDPVMEPGGNATVFDIPLYADGGAAGWNFVSFNLMPSDTSLTAILDHPTHGISGNYDKVMYYDAWSGEWLSYAPGRAERYNNLHSWNHRMGIWIHMSAADTLTVEGFLPTSTDITLYPGWNMVGLPGGSAGNHGLPAEVTRIGYFDAVAEYNLVYTEDVDVFEFQPGEGYWVYNGADEAVVWTVDY